MWLRTIHRVAAGGGLDGEASTREQDERRERCEVPAPCRRRQLRAREKVDLEELARAAGQIGMTGSQL
eukprot:7388477-Prymnesium_polylepis.1